VQYFSRANGHNHRTVSLRIKNKRAAQMSSTQQQQGQTINVADLDLAQLADVRRQLEEVHCSFYTRMYVRAEVEELICFFIWRERLLGTQPPHELVHSAQAGTGKIPVVRREREGGQAWE
jgi:hypothetical protein